jgi:hypothetical protein
MSHVANNALVSDVARDVLAEIAPDELPIFQAASKAYFADPKAVAKQAKSKDSMLGMGPDSVTLLTPAVLHVVTEVCIFLAPVATEVAKSALAEGATEVFKGIFRRYGSKSPPVLTPEQIQMVQAKVRAEAKKMRLPGNQAEILTNAVIAQLVLSAE